MPSAGSAWPLPEQLAALDLSGNAISGALPTREQLPASLQALRVGNNRLSGGVPSSDWLPPVRVLGGGRAGAGLLAVW